MSCQMNTAHGAASLDLTYHRQNEPYKRLSGPHLIFVRSLWIATVVPAYVVFIVNIPAYYASLHLQRAPDMQTFSVQLTSSDIQALQSMGLSLDFYAAAMVVVTLLFQFSYALVGLLIFFR